MKFKVGDFVEIPFRLNSDRYLVDYKQDFPEVKKKAIGIVICIVPIVFYNLLLGFPLGAVRGNWTGLYKNYFEENKIPNYIRYQYEFWFTNENHLKLIEKEYEI